MFHLAAERGCASSVYTDVASCLQETRSDDDLFFVVVVIVVVVSVMVIV